jgi:hypothetical protein
MVSYFFDLLIRSRTKLFHSRLARSHPGGGLFCSKKVRKGSLNPSTIPELANRSIAIDAKKSSDPASDMVVIDVERIFSGRARSADFAPAARSFNNCSILFNRETVPVLSHVVLFCSNPLGVTPSLFLELLEMFCVVLPPTFICCRTLWCPRTSASHSPTFSLGIQV